MKNEENKTLCRGLFRSAFGLLFGSVNSKLHHNGSKRVFPNKLLALPLSRSLLLSVLVVLARVLWTNARKSGIPTNPIKGSVRVIAQDEMAILNPGQSREPFKPMVESKSMLLSWREGLPLLAYLARVLMPLWSKPRELSWFNPSNTSEGNSSILLWARTKAWMVGITFPNCPLTLWIWLCATVNTWREFRPWKNRASIPWRRLWDRSKATRLLRAWNGLSCNHLLVKALWDRFSTTRWVSRSNKPLGSWLRVLLER